MNTRSEAAIVGVDVGGTFTDAVVATGGRLVTAKVATTPEDQGIGVIDAVTRALAAAGIDAGAVARFAHGMTVGTNALLEGTGAPIALVTTEGFADVIALRRQDRAHLYRLEAHHPAPLVPAERRLEVTERCGPDGVVTPLDDASLTEAINALGEMEIDAVAVGLLFSFAHPEHERAVAAAIRAAHPHLHVSASTEVLPEIREYERIATTCVDAHLAPVMRRYLGALGRRATSVNLPEPEIMQSNGGLIGLDQAADHAAWTVLSGPAAGVIGAAHVARLAGEERVLAFDMGGTSCDVALIDGEPARTTQNTINGHPLHLPMLDIHTVSAGGGSIAWADAGGALRVGPTSAGAVPGPACYGRGGTAPTVTDANVVLGRIDVGHPLADGLTLDADRARSAVAGLARELRMDLGACAQGIVAVAVNEMSRALRVVSVERGIDPRGMALVAFGGAGPLHACDVADALGMRTVLIPAAAGLLAALGLIVAGERRDAVRSVLLPIQDASGLRAAASALSERLRGELPAGDISASADCRYVGQTHALTVAWDPRTPSDELAAAFHEAHRARFGDADPGWPVQVVSVRAAVATAGVAPEVRSVDEPPPQGGPVPFATDGATVWLAKGWRATRDPHGTIRLER